MRTRHSNFFCLIAMMIFACVGVVLFGCVGTAQNQANAELTKTKLYSYQVTQTNNLLYVAGAYSNGETYNLTPSGTTFEQISDIIDMDRLLGANFSDASINFNAISVGNTYIQLKNGNLTVSGGLSGSGYSTFGLIYIDGANVTFQNAQFENNGLSYLIRNAGSGTLTFESGTYSSIDTTVMISGSGDVCVYGGALSSTNGSVIANVGQEKNEITIANIENNLTLTANSNQPAVRSNTAKLNFGTCKIISKKGVCVEAENADILLYDNPSFEGKDCYISTNAKIINQLESATYTGGKIIVSYTGEIVSGNTIVVENGNLNFYELNSGDYTLNQKTDNLVATKISTLTYKDNNSFIIRLPVDLTKYTPNEMASVQFINENTDLKKNIKETYTFLGWNTDPNATVATYTQSGPNTITFQEENIVLYAIWQAKTYSITYVNSTIESPTSYLTDVDTTIENPTKEYYIFTGWTTSTYDTPTKDYVITKGTFGDITLTANWEYAEYDIVYNGLTDEDVFALNLKTVYTINDESYSISENDVICKGYGIFGLYYDKDFSVACDDTIYFKLSEMQQNSQEFKDYNTIGQTINLFVDARAYNNGQGNGSENNPYCIDSETQFENLLSGEKDFSEKIYLKLVSDIKYQTNLGEDFSGFENFVFDGQNHTITISKFNEFDGYISLFPEVKNSQIKNTKIVCDETLFVENDAKFGCLCGKVENLTLENVEQNINVSIIHKKAEDASTISFAGLAVDAKNLIANNIKITSNFVFDEQIEDVEVNIYGASFVGNGCENSVFSNCQNEGSINVKLAENIQQTNTYIATFANLGCNNKIVNCLIEGNLNFEQTSNNLALISGGVTVFDVNNEFKNCVCNATVLVQGEPQKVLTNQFVTGKTECCTTENLFSANDLDVDLKGTIASLNSKLEEYKYIAGVDLNKWYPTLEGSVTFQQTYIVTYVGNGLFQDETKSFGCLEDASKYVPKFNFSDYIFHNWNDAEGQSVNWKNISTSFVTVYAIYETLDSYIANDMIAYYIALGVLFIVAICAMAIFDCRKTVRFIVDGEVVSKFKLARSKKIKLPENVQAKIWFCEPECVTPVEKYVMPFHAITFYALSGENQLRAEQKVIDKKEQLVVAQKQKLLEKKTQKLEKQLKKENMHQEKLIKKQQKHMAKTKKQNSKATAEEKTTLQIDDGKITIIKKEIKLFNQENVQKTQENNQEDLILNNEKREEVNKQLDNKTHSEE